MNQEKYKAIPVWVGFITRFVLYFDNFTVIFEGIIITVAELYFAEG